MYAYGRGVSKDPVEAMRWYRKAADQGNASAELHIGAMYGAGDGVNKDYAEAMKWFRKSADQGNQYAQLNVSKMYEKGRGVKQDHEEAYFWRLIAEKSASVNRPVPANFTARQYYLTPEQALAVMKRAQEWRPITTQHSTVRKTSETR
jgi:TPR repeat protein